MQSQSLFGLCKCFALASPQPQTVPVPCNLLLCEACLLTAQQTITAVAVARYTCGFIGAGPNLDGASVYNALEDFRVNGTAGVPTVFLGLLDYMATNNKKLNYLKVAAVGGAACPPKVLEKFDRCAFFRMQCYRPFHHSLQCSAQSMQYDCQGACVLSRIRAPL